MRSALERAQELYVNDNKLTTLEPLSTLSLNLRREGVCYNNALLKPHARMYVGPHC